MRPGALPPTVCDDYGDVYGMYFVIYGDGYSMAELKEHAKLLRRELLLCQDVAKIELKGERDEVIYFEISRARLANMGISIAEIKKLISGQNDAANAGHLTVGDKYIRIDPVGVVVGLLSFSQPFGFMALLGLLSLIGMQIKNAIVLIDEINARQEAGDSAIDAVVSAGITRLRPVGMAAATTVLGMIPLVADPFYSAMAVTVMCGLAFATVLTMIVIPVNYAIFFHLPAPGNKRGKRGG